MRVQVQNGSREIHPPATTAKASTRNASFNTRKIVPAAINAFDTFLKGLGSSMFYRFVRLYPIVALWVLASTAYGQEVRASITGAVSDPTGAAIANAVVTVTNK